MKKNIMSFILLLTLFCVSCSSQKESRLENTDHTDTSEAVNIPAADVSVMAAPPDVMPGRSAEISFTNGMGWETFEATASLGKLSCGNHSSRQTVVGNKDDSIKWSYDEFSQPNGFIQIKFFDSDGNHVLSRTVLINGQDNLYYKVVAMDQAP